MNGVYGAGIIKRPRRTKAEMQTLRAQIYAILSQIQPCSVRAVCYQLFIRKLISSMAKSETNRIGRILTLERESGMLPWAWVVDETRDLERVPSWDDPAEYSEAVKESYRRDRWVQQTDRVEVWSEKGTIRGTLQPVLDEYGVGFRVMHGYTSATSAHDIAVGSQQGRQSLVALYVGDWDPSGLHMSEVDLIKRLQRYGARGRMRRLALSLEDVEGGTLPAFPVEDKRKDPRYNWFVQHHGRQFWELDALDPNILRARVAAAIREYIDWPAWNRCALAEQAERLSLADVLGSWKEAAS